MSDKPPKGTPCDHCPVWETIASDIRYRQITTTRSIGAQRGLQFVFLPREKKVVIVLPVELPEEAVSGYPHSFNEQAFKVMCYRFSEVTEILPQPPSTYVGNIAFNRPKWNPPPGVFSNPTIDPPYLVAVVRKVLEDHPSLDYNGYC